MLVNLIVCNANETNIPMLLLFLYCVIIFPHFRSYFPILSNKMFLLFDCIKLIRKYTNTANFVRTAANTLPNNPNSHVSANTQPYNQNSRIAAKTLPNNPNTSLAANTLPTHPGIQNSSSTAGFQPNRASLPPLPLSIPPSRSRKILCMLLSYLQHF